MPQTTTTSEEDEEEEQKMTLRTFHKLFLLRLKNDRQRRQKSVRERESKQKTPKKNRRKKLNLCPHPIEARQPQQQCNTKWHAATTLSVSLPHPL